MSEITLPKVDNRDMSYVQQFIDREMDNLKNTIWNSLCHMANPRQMELRDDGNYYCPSCGRFFNMAHAQTHPNFCEHCGQAFEYEDDGNGGGLIMHKTTVELIKRMFKKEKQLWRIRGCGVDSKIDEVCAAERDFDRAVERLNGTE